MGQRAKPCACPYAVGPVGVSIGAAPANQLEIWPPPLGGDLCFLCRGATSPPKLWAKGRANPQWARGLQIRRLRPSGPARHLEHVWWHPHKGRQQGRGMPPSAHQPRWGAAYCGPGGLWGGWHGNSLRPTNKSRVELVPGDLGAHPSPTQQARSRVVLAGLFGWRCHASCGALLGRKRHVCCDGVGCAHPPGRPRWHLCPGRSGCQPLGGGRGAGAVEIQVPRAHTGRRGRRGVAPAPKVLQACCSRPNVVELWVGCAAGWPPPPGVGSR